MQEERDQPDEGSQRPRWEREQHQPPGHSELIEQRTVILPLREAGMDRSFIDVTAKRFRDDPAGNDRKDRR